MKSELQTIQHHWERPVLWTIDQESQDIRVLDEDGNCVVSSISHKELKSSVEQHLKEVQTAVALELLQSVADDTEV